MTKGEYLRSMHKDDPTLVEAKNFLVQAQNAADADPLAGVTFHDESMEITSGDLERMNRMLTPFSAGLIVHHFPETDKHQFLARYFNVQPVDADPVPYDSAMDQSIGLEDFPNRPQPATLAPPEWLIARLAYQIWYDRGQPDGTADMDWRIAEAVLKLETLYGDNWISERVLGPDSKITSA